MRDRGVGGADRKVRRGDGIGAPRNGSGRSRARSNGAQTGRPYRGGSSCGAARSPDARWVEAARTSVYRSAVASEVLHSQRKSAASVLGGARKDADLALIEGRLSMTDSFAHHLRIDQIRDGELFELVADETERARRPAARPPGAGPAGGAGDASRKGRVIHAEGRVGGLARPGLRDHRRTGAGACRRTVRADLHARPEAAGRRKRSSLARPIATSCSTTAHDRSRCGDRRYAGAGFDPFRAAPAPTPRSRKRAC